MKARESAAFAVATTPWFPSLRKRVEIEELLDLGTCTEADVRDSLADLDRLNRFFGGWSGLRKHLLPRVAELHAQRNESGPIRVLDLGSGTGYLPRRLASWADRRGLPLEVVAVDVKPAHVQIGMERQSGCRIEPQFVVADVGALPFPAKSFDFVFSNLFLHHFPPEAAREQLRRSAEIARHGVVVNDLIRHRVPYLFLKLTGPVLVRSPVTRYDGLASLRRAYAPAELDALAREAGLEDVHVDTFFPWRQCLIARTGPAPAGHEAPGGSRAGQEPPTLPSRAQIAPVEASANGAGRQRGNS